MNPRCPLLPPTSGLKLSTRFAQGVSGSGPHATNERTDTIDIDWNRPLLPTLICEFKVYASFAKG
ncbi:hypothetical protein GCM10011608_05200 [Micromonospora sonchi]|uniref:Uncharacterized protein n=1 Tax=Micromonospora sonchi TaxID=1763543 RepID=A0A917TJU2_9ACTN|nr:hypothetical protein GCM10011608_05200 [Micromonospora sonchi]